VLSERSTEVIVDGSGSLVADVVSTRSSLVASGAVVLLVFCAARAACDSTAGCPAVVGCPVVLGCRVVACCPVMAGCPVVADCPVVSGCPELVGPVAVIA